MKTETLLAERLRSHRLSAPTATPLDAARHMLAVQSQDFTAGRWALAVRSRGSVTLTAVDRAFARGDLVRGWTMRGTLHIVPARDLSWVLSVTGERQRQQAASRHRDLGIDDEIVATAERALRPALDDGGCTRAEAFELLERVGIDPRGQRGIHLLFTLTLNGVLCQGPVVQRGSAISREQLFVPVEHHIRESATPEDPLAELFVRYIDGHGPAGASDFAWWSGLTLGLAREAVERGRHRVTEIEEGVFVAAQPPRRSSAAADVHALGYFDEYYISYADRTAVCAPEHLAAVGPGKNGMVRPVLVAGGRVIGLWSTPSATGRNAIPTPEPFAGASAPDDAVSLALSRYSAFLGAAQSLAE